MGRFSDVTKKRKVCVVLTARTSYTKIKPILLALSKLSNMELVYDINHFHETINELTETFGREYDIISVRRNRYERFISLWKHVIDLVNDRYPSNVTDTLRSIKLENLFFYKKEDL
jgi:hypothetical protein